ncbi:MAG: GxxExxY protein [Pyrinomonadaceae bacterium]
MVGSFEADILVNDAVIFELKAVRAIDDSHRAQLMNYLRATEVEVRLLLNFGQKPELKRIVFVNQRTAIRGSGRLSSTGVIARIDQT